MKYKTNLDKKEMKMKNLIGFTPELLAALEADDIWWPITSEEVLHLIFNIPGKATGRPGHYAWEYNYLKLESGQPGEHAQLRKGQHSDGFINVKELMSDYPNICMIFADQLANELKDTYDIQADYVAGVPSAAVTLGQNVAMLMQLPHLDLRKIDDKTFAVDGPIPELGRVLLIDDVFTTGDGRRTAAKMLEALGFVVLDDEVCVVDRSSNLWVISLARFTKKEWWPERGEVCELCAKHSKPRKPKTSPEVWEAFIHSQD
jgi:orotate phosphoribosyltransferase